MPDRTLQLAINAYPDAPLNGCINDMLDMAEFVVTNRNVARHNVRLLANGRCKTVAMRDRLLHFAKQLKAGDSGLLQFSGHGTQVASRGDDQEIDGMDEVLCPVDFDWSPERMITDDELFDILSKVEPGARLFFISDSCHSGTMTRDMVPYKSRAYPIPPDIAWRNQAARSLKTVKPKPAKTRALVDGKLNVAFISGCKDNQTSADAYFNGRPNGALTFHLLDALRKADRLTPVKVLVDTTVKALADAGYSQIPQVDGPQASFPFM